MTTSVSISTNLKPFFQPKNQFSHCFHRDLLCHFNSSCQGADSTAFLQELDGTWNPSRKMSFSLKGNTKIRRKIICTHSIYRCGNTKRPSNRTSASFRLYLLWFQFFVLRGVTEASTVIFETQTWLKLACHTFWLLGFSKGNWPTSLQKCTEEKPRVWVITWCQIWNCFMCWASGGCLFITWSAIQHHVFALSCLASRLLITSNKLPTTLPVTVVLLEQTWLHERERERERDWC